MQTACRIEKYEVVAVLFGVPNGGLGDIHRICRAHLEHGDIKLIADGFELLYSGGSVNIAGCKQRTLALLSHIGCKLCAVGGLTCALKSDQHNYARRP